MGNAKTSDRKFAALKAELFDWGRDYIEDFLCYEYPWDEDKEITDARMDQRYEEMDNDELQEWYDKFCI